MKRSFLLVLAALVLQLAMADLFAWTWEAGYGEPRSIDEALEGPLTFFGLVLGGPLATTFAAVAVYCAQRSPRPPWARAGFAALAFPLLLVGGFATHVLLCVAGVW
ncbi:MAG: hypothetical protein FJ306_01775 [Planctomycetes bacterium]|nr:hypothetical protein [Planctomycetota bacterium]